MSRETILLLVGAYFGVLMLVLAVLATAKRGDEAAAAWQAGEGRGDEPRRRDAA